MARVDVVRRLPLVCYFALAFLLSGAALAVVGLPSLHDSTQKPSASLVAFPIMVVGVGMLGVVMTVATDGRGGVRHLRLRLTRRVKWRWWLVLALPPLAILAVLMALEASVSPRYAPGFLIFGFAAGAFAGCLEELGWTGFAYPRMRARLGAFGGALLLGILWGLWHLPVVDSLGAASPHGRHWLAFFGAFVAMIVALRVLIAWVYTNTGSLRMAQLLHASSTGFLVVLGAQRASAGQEALWYLAYATVLWAVVIVVVALQGPNLVNEPPVGGRPQGGHVPVSEPVLSVDQVETSAVVGDAATRAEPSCSAASPTRSAPLRVNQRNNYNERKTMGTPAVAWFEVTGKDGASLQDFYGKLFDWQIKDAGDGSGYGLVAAADKGIGGGIGPAQDGGAGAVTFYVEVDDIAGYLERAEELGGQTIVPPTEIEHFGLTFAFFADPEGHVVGLSKGAVQ